jgi:hypothetical protein
MRFISALLEGFAFALGFFVLFPVFTGVIQTLARVLF